MGLVVAYHCGGEYRAEAERLGASLRLLNLDYLIIEIPDRGSWRKNVHAKPEIILQARRTRPFTDILYVDADSVIHEDPFAALQDGDLGDCDIAVHHFRGVECCSGTIWMPWTYKRAAHGDSLLRRWSDLNDRDGNDTIPQPQAVLAQALGAAGGELNVAELPASHCYIFDLSKQVHPDVKPLIEHLQASRDLRDDRPRSCDNGPRAARIAELAGPARRLEGQTAGERLEVRGENSEQDGKGDRGLTVVGFYTLGAAYEREAARLAASLDRVGMKHRIRGYESAGDWDANVAMKCGALGIAMDLGDCPLVYVDVDAVVHENCSEYFEDLARAGVDFAAHWFQGPTGGHDRSRNDNHFLSGTMFFNDSPLALELLAAWDAENKKQVAKGNLHGQGQRNLQTVLDEGRVAGLKIAKLPGRYCRVFDKPWAYPKGEPVIIEHLIASRENRGVSAGKTNAARQKRIAELEMMMEMTT